MTINNKSERNYRGKCLGWPVTSYGGAYKKCKIHAGIINCDVLQAFPAQGKPSLNVCRITLITKCFFFLFYLIISLVFFLDVCHAEKIIVFLSLGLAILIFDRKQ